MEFIAKQAALLRELNLVQGVVEKKNTVPILANVLLSAKGDSVVVMATDLEVGVKSELSANVVKEGALTVSARKLHEIVRSLPDSEVQVKSDGESWATLACERSHFRIMGLPKDDFPTLPTPGKTPRVTFGMQQFKEMVRKVIFAVSAEDARFALNGALMIVDGNSVSLVASDGHRLSYVSMPLQGGGSGAEMRVVIPQKALGEISRIGDEIGGEIVFCRDENHMFFEMGRCTLSSRLLEGQFPNFEKVLPKGNDKIIELGRVAFSDGLHRVSLLANERNRAVKLSLGRGKLEISAKNPEMGEARETLNIEYGGGDVEVGFNAKYFLDFLSAVDKETVILELKDEASQALLRPKDGAGKTKEPAGEYKYVVMPMRI
ncbi:MAG TPA: DNA polymerase III subunit beta [Candidatus Polarisedimenticolia bacterium]|nr:DNA polymerase III subunit beta [Candidatus Polarisedimenticolia bacterium]